MSCFVVGSQQFNNSNSNQLSTVNSKEEQASSVHEARQFLSNNSDSNSFNFPSTSDTPSNHLNHKSPIAAPRQSKDIQSLSTSALYENIEAVVNRCPPGTGLTPPSRCSGYSSGSSENDLVTAQLDNMDSIDTIPEDLSTLTVSGLAECLRLFELPNVAHRFKQHQIDGQFFNIMSDQMFKDDNFGFSEFEILKLKKLRDGWRPKLG